jgi:general secretion pathway protein G
MGDESKGRCSMNGKDRVEGEWTMWSRNGRRQDSLAWRLTPPALGGTAGFTFIEIMVVVAILAILAALVVPRIMGRTDDAKRTAAKVQIRNIEGALQLYKLDNGVYPSTEQGLKALIEKPSVGVVPKKWKIGGYLPKLPEDPWGNPYKYLSPAQGSIQSPGQSPGLRGEYEVISLGTDGEVGGEGVNADITNWNLDKD